MIAVMWQFDVKKGREKEFEKLYGADGDWTALNRRTRSYLGSVSCATRVGRRAMC